LGTGMTFSDGSKMDQTQKSANVNLSAATY
jgi:hypothetical protein